MIETLHRLASPGGGIQVYTPQDEGFDLKSASSNPRLALQVDNFDLDSIGGILPGLAEPQMRVLDAAIRKWKRDHPEQPRDVQVLIELLSRRPDEVRDDPNRNLTDKERKALGARSAVIAGMRLRQLLQQAKALYGARARSVTADKGNAGTVILFEVPPALGGQGMRSLRGHGQRNAGSFSASGYARRPAEARQH